MAGHSTYTSASSLSESYRECIQLFGRFLLALSEKDCRVIHLEQVRLPEIMEEYGRTKIWGDQTKADLPARARGSLDDTLRHDVELQHLVQATLMRLRALLGQAILIAQRKYDPTVGEDHDSVSSVSAESDSDLDDERENQRQRMPKIRLLVQQMLEQIRSLYDLSSLLRRPKITDKYIRSVNSKSNTANLSDSDTSLSIIGFSSSDENHVMEKVLQWRGLTKSGRSVEFEDEDVAPVRQNWTSDWVEDIRWFCQRLARANTRRRDQLQYWANHPFNPKQDAPDAACLVTPDLAQIPARQETQESRSQVSTLKPLDSNFPREAPKSTMSKQSFSTAAVSDIHDTKTNARPRTVYAPTVIGHARSNFVPDPPGTANENATFTCPYCGTTLDSSEMQNRQSWKRHVFHDLRPYVCTFGDCQNAGKLYVNRHDWIYHELQIHRREYVCGVCSRIYSNRKEMSTHLRNHYDESISPAQVGIILDLCNRQVDVSDNEKDSCLVCGEELSLSALQGHLAAHMEDIALFVLPNTNEEEDEAGGSKASVQVAKLESTGKTSNAQSETSSLGFSAAGNHEQAPADFANIITSKEVGYASKFSSWRTADEDSSDRESYHLTSTSAEGLPKRTTDEESYGRVTYPLSPTSTEDLQGRTPRGRKKGLTYEQRTKAAVMRVIGACSNCKLRKEKCDPYTPCKSCIEHFKGDLVKNPCRGRLLSDLSSAFLSNQVRWHPTARSLESFLEPRSFDISTDTTYTIPLIFGFSVPITVQVHPLQFKDVPMLTHNHFVYSWPPESTSPGRQQTHAVLPAILTSDTASILMQTLDTHLSLLVSQHFRGFPLYLSPLRVLREVYVLSRCLNTASHYSQILHQALKLLVLVHVGGDITVFLPSDRSDLAELIHNTMDLPEYLSPTPCFIRSQFGAIMPELALSLMKEVLLSLEQLFLNRDYAEWPVALAILITVLMTIESIQYHAAKLPYHYSYDFSQPIDNLEVDDESVNALLDFYSACFSECHGRLRPDWKGEAAPSQSSSETLSPEDTFIENVRETIKNAGMGYLAKKADQKRQGNDMDFFFDRLVARLLLLKT